MTPNKYPKQFAVNPLRILAILLFSRKAQIKILGLILVFLTSCSPRPPTHTQFLMPKATRNGTQIIADPTDLTQADLRRVKWWEKMHDPLLNHLIKLTLLRNNQLKTAQANIRQAEAQLKEARFAWLPSLNASGRGFVGGGWDSEFTPQGPLALSPGISRTGSIHFRGYYAGFVPNYSLNILSNVQKGKYAKASLAMQAASYQSARLSLISQITGAYFMLLGQKAQLNDQQNYLQDLKKLRQLEWSRYQAGSSDLSTVIDLDQQIVSNQANLATLENSLSQVENSIQILINRNPGPLLKAGKLKALTNTHLIPKNLPANVLKHRPDVIMAQKNLRITEANIGIAYSNFFPTISLTGLLGGASFDLTHLLSLSTGLWIAEAAASIPILNGVSYEQIKEAKAGYLAAYFNYLQTLRVALADVDNSLTQQQKMRQAYENQIKGLKAAERGLALASARYQAGVRDYRDVLTAKLAVDSAALNVTLAKMQQLDSLVGLYQALAAGYC